MGPKTRRTGVRRSDQCDTLPQNCARHMPSSTAAGDDHIVSKQHLCAGLESDSIDIHPLSAAGSGKFERRQPRSGEHAHLWDCARLFALAGMIAPSKQPRNTRATLLAGEAKPQPQLAGPNLQSATSAVGDEVHRPDQSFIRAIQLTMRNVGIQLRWEGNANRSTESISGRG